MQLIEVYHKYNNLIKMQEKIQNFKQSQLTQVLADGFAELYHRRPQFPVAYLAAYLKNYNKSKQLKKSMLTDRISSNKAICEQITKQKQSEQAFKNEQKKREAESIEQENKYLKKIADTQYHADILNQFCTWLEDNFMLTGAYLGELKNRKKIVDIQEDDSEQAHFDPQAQKLIYFQAYSKSHAELLKNKTLAADSVLGRLLSAASGSAQQQPQQGQQVKEQGPKDQVYFPSVVDKQELTFFRFPRLGAFYGIGIKMKSYMSDKLIEPNASKIQAYFKAIEEYERQKEQRETKFRQGYDEKAGSGAQEQELEEMQKQFQNEQKNFPKPEYPELQFIERQFVFGCDTLGQDRQISKQDRVKIREHLQFLKNKWESREIETLKTDIQRHLKLSDKLQTPGPELLAKIIQDQDKELPSSEQVQKYKDNQKLMELEMDTLRIQKIKQYLVDEKYTPFIQEILSAKILKFHEVIKYWLLFTSYKKQDINVENTNLLDFRKARKLLKQNTFIHKLTEYNPRGAKPQVQVLNYAKWERMQQNLEKIDVTAVAAYNIYLAFIHRALLLIAKVRQADRVKRVGIMLEQRKNRRQRIKENAEKQKNHDVKLSAAKAEAQEKEEQFDEQAWENQYIEQQENQLAQVGPPIEDQIDKDLQNGQQLFPEPQQQEPPAEQEPQNPPE